MTYYFSFLVLCGIFCFQIRGQDEDVVTYSDGTVQGMLYDSSRAFLGLPFAAPPIGDLRFASPKPPMKWNGTRSAKKFSPGCMQVCSLPDGACADVHDEDCLYLNVWTPRIQIPKYVASPWPVMVWIHGGAFKEGSASTLFYNGSYIASATNQVVVSLNYRLNGFGFLATEATKNNLNIGLQDQILALKWVQSNIAVFGGDPDQVTVFGESAGAMSIAIHLVSPLSKGLFHQAIMESNAPGLGYFEKSKGLDVGDIFTTKIGCPPVVTDQLACLRKMDADALRNYSAGSLATFDWFPQIDNVFFSEQPIDSFKKGKYADIPVLLGTNSNEGILFVWEVLNNTSLNDIEYRTAVEGLFPGHETSITKVYPPQGKDNRIQLSLVQGHAQFNCATRAIARYMTAGKQKSTTYLYNFAHKPSFDTWPSLSGHPCIGKVCHASEVPFVFNLPVSGQNVTQNITEGETRLMETIVSYWGEFSKTGQPSKNSSQWPAYESSQNKSMLLLTPQEGLGPVSNYMQEKCDFWDHIGYP